MTTTSTYEPLLAGIGLAGYRSFNQWQTFLFPSKITVLAGINNSGKSNLLRFLQEVLPKLVSDNSNSVGPGPGAVELKNPDTPLGFGSTAPLEVGIPIPLGGRGPRQNPLSRDGAVIDNLASYQEGAMSLLAEGDLYWSRFRLRDGLFVPPPESVRVATETWPHWSLHHSKVGMAVPGRQRDSEDTMRRLLHSIDGFVGLPSVATIASARRIQDAGNQAANWLTGLGLVEALAALQVPQAEHWAVDLPKWESINRFVRVVLGDEDATLRIPHTIDTILVETPQRVLSLSGLGAGVEQVIVLAAAATLTTNTLVCVEEPETNLHPLLQRKLLRYLQSETDNQYVIATHSSHVLDDASSTAYHLRLTTEGTRSRVARRPHEFVAICNDLGYRPSDFLQANCVIWVEGPSDRTYIRAWLDLVDGSLIENVDYSIMFYGGRLISHLSLGDEPLDNFIALRQLNRSSTIVIDSDMTSADMELGKTKRRIQDEYLGQDPASGFAWVTAGYTIENYIPEDVLTAAVAEVHPGASRVPLARWVNPFPSRKGGPRYDKVGIADAVARRLQSEDLDVFDLRERVDGLREFIRAANGQSTAP